MPEYVTLFRAFIASPGDCKEERIALPQIIHRWNAANSLHTKAVIEPVLWETHATPDYGARPQAIINEQLLQDCDFLVGVFWTRLGTGTDKAASGTAEEIEEFRSKGKRVLLYFSTAPVALDSVDTEQLEALKAYKSEVKQKGLTVDYTDV